MMLSSTAAVASSGASRRRLARPLTFAWDQVEGLTYRLYYGAASGTYSAYIEVGAVGMYSMQHPGVRRYYALTAVDSTGGESEHSDEVFA